MSPGRSNTTQIDTTTVVELGGGIDSGVEIILRRTLSGRPLDREIDDEGALREYLQQYRERFDSLFDGTEYVRDPRVARLVRVFDYSFRVGFDCEDFFNNKLKSGLSPEEAIATFRNFFRLAAIALTEDIGRPEIIRQLKISGINNPSDQMMSPARDLAASIREATKERLDEIYAALVMLKSGIID